VIYPDQFHLFTRPSYIHDRLERYFAWYDKYLKPWETCRRFETRSDQRRETPV